MCGEVVYEKPVIGKGEPAQLAAGEAARMLLLLQLPLLLLLSAQQFNNHRGPVLQLAFRLLTAGHK
jgi:hypothetical protein